MAESRTGTDKKTAVRGNAPAAKPAPAAKAAAAAPAPSVVIRRVRRPVGDEAPVSTAAPSSLGIGNRRVSTMVDVAPETLALFETGAFSYAPEPGPVGI